MTTEPTPKFTPADHIASEYTVQDPAAAVPAPGWPAPGMGTPGMATGRAGVPASAFSATAPQAAVSPGAGQQGAAPQGAMLQGAAAKAAAPRASLVIPLLVGAVVSLTLGLFARFHVATGIAVDVAGFSSPLAAKAWLTTLAAVLAVAQLISALIIYGKIRVKAPSWIGTFHRWSGRIAFLATIPVALHCLFAFGFSTYTTRVLIHSLLGCLFYGVFTMKMLVLTKRGLAGWVLPVAGGLVFAALIGLWSTSALFFFHTKGVTF